ncbi:hemin uptake protein HemP [Psychromarinibacter halotolerans]|uniref:Hemin uptake protein HemP n=1 Tax=Psychromarinibacter halotolerans TaxID=1775175 RepID=A0ABV7GRE8_9RHOB|nr:hemin uptake protein HemP [Psychromarinibacter halotolerans]MAQ86413.1 hypothetical protein [Maritimibacter sp.]MDF0597140.1 hemin uptake protein HemP [Psychromarinibacter halotolerans]
MTFEDKKVIDAQTGFPTYRAEDLVAGGREAKILLGDQCYTLRITRAGKLILTK